MNEQSILERNLSGLSGAPFKGHVYETAVFKHDRSEFIDRVETIGFKGGERVLDAGCGYGQFSYALAQFNREVIAVDRSDAMVEMARFLVERWGAPNVTVEKQSLPKLPYEDASFDFIWCAGVLNIIDKYASMREFNRLLRPGGRVFVQTNAWGRWLFKAARHYQNGNRRAMEQCLVALMHGTEPGTKANYLELGEADRFCTECGFTLIASAPAGGINLSGLERKEGEGLDPHLFMTMEGDHRLVLDGNIELVAEKPGGPDAQSL